MDNALADHLAPIFHPAGLTDVCKTLQHEAASRSDPNFAALVGRWGEVAATRGFQMVEEAR